MKTKARICVSTGSVVLSALVLFNIPVVCSGQESTIFTYQGRLSSGAGLANGAYDFKFSIYDSTNQPGVLIAGPLTNFTVVVSNGLFTTPLDFGVAPFDGSDRWLDIAVRTNGAASFTSLSSRQQITLAPYAIMSRAALFAVSNFTVGSALVLPPTNVTFYSGGGSVFHSDSHQENVFVGPGAGNWPATSASANTAVGNNALESDTAAGDNSAFGDGALAANTIGIANTAVGASAMSGNTSGSYNTALGVFALGGFSSGASGAYNSAEGYFAMAGLTTGNNNTAHGGFSMIQNTTGGFNVADGYQTLYNNISGSGNTAIGNTALYSNTGGYNTAVGNQALYLKTTGNDNIALGDGAGYSVTGGSWNIHIGSAGTASDDHVIRIGQQGTQTNTYIAGISGTSVSGGAQVYVNSSGQLGSVVPAFIHTVTAGNISTSIYTIIDNPLCNNKPNAILFVTANGNGTALLTSSFFVVYYAPHWLIGADSGNMVAGMQFNVLVANP